MINFSIVIPTFNRAKELDRCLDSLCKQSYKHFEVIICDDGSSDNTLGIVRSYEKRLLINYFYLENWGGPAKPRNIGIKNAKGEWICFLDSDDWFTTDKLERIATEDLTKYDLIYHDLFITGRGANKMMTSRNLSDDVYHDLLFNLNAIPTSSACVRKKMLVQVNGFSEERSLIAVEDFDLWIRLGELGIKAKYLPVCLGYYNLGTDNITAYDETQIRRFDALYKPYIEKAGNTNDRNKIKGALFYQKGRIYTKSGNPMKAIKALTGAAKYGSLNIKFRSVYQIFLGLIKFRS